jgi:hypothetical protein
MNPSVPKIVQELPQLTLPKQGPFGLKGGAQKLQ